MYICIYMYIYIYSYTTYNTIQYNAIQCNTMHEALGVMQAMHDSHALPLAKALHMVRALRLAHPAQTLVTASWGELGTEVLTLLALLVEKW